MRDSPTELVRSFTRLRVAVLGEAMLDSYSAGSTGRLCPEAPVPVVDVASRHDLPGGAANSAVNIAGLEARPLLLSVIGDDADSSRLRESLLAYGVPTEQLIARPGRRTLAKHRIIADSHLLVRFDEGTREPLDAESEQRLIEAMRQVVPHCDAVVVSDYDYGILTPRVIECLAQLQRQAPRVMVVDSKHLTAFRHVGVTAVKPNYRQVLELLGASDHERFTSRAEFVAAQGDRILELTGAQMAAVTLDSDGAVLLQRGHEAYRTPCRTTPRSHVSGAGDTYLSALALALAAGAPAADAAEVACAAAAVVVAKEHTARCSPEELIEQLSGESRPGTDLARLMPILEEHRRRGRRIVLTNGCFDILHRGHIAYLHRAKTLGEVLVVGVNSDPSIQRLKGTGRPINKLEDRLGVLAALSCIDHLVPFDEDTPHRLIEAVRPDVFVKGGDYTRETLPEASLVESLGGCVKILPFVSDRSTTTIIERICETYGRAPKNSPPDFPGDDHAEPTLDRRYQYSVR